MTKCYFCYGVDKCCAECAKKEKLKVLAARVPSPNEAKPPDENEVEYAPHSVTEWDPEWGPEPEW